MLNKIIIYVITKTGFKADKISIFINGLSILFLITTSQC